MNPIEINRIVYIFDENCTGYITKKQFLQTLITYGVNSEEIDDDLMSIGQKSLIDFTRYL